MRLELYIPPKDQSWSWDLEQYSMPWESLYTTCSWTFPHLHGQEITLHELVQLAAQYYMCYLWKWTVCTVGTVIQLPQHSRITQDFSYIWPSSPLATYAREKETGIKARDRRADSTPVTEGTPGEERHTNGGKNCICPEKVTALLQ